MMKKQFILTSLVFILAIGCAKKPANQVDIGVLMPLTGDAASLGVPAWNAIQLAVEEENVRTRNNPTIKLIAEDTKALPAVGVSAIRKLIDVNKIRLIIGPLTSTVTIAVAPIAEENKVVIISPGASAPSISDVGEYIFRDELSDYEGGKIQAEYAISKLGYRKIACVYINTDYGVGLLDVFKKYFEAGGGKVLLSEAFIQGTTDFRSILTKIKALSVDAIFVIAIDEIINFVKQKEELGMKEVIYTTPIFENQLYIDKLGKLAEGIIYVYYGIYDPESNNEEIKSFVLKYKNRFGDYPTYYSANAYDATNILINALKKSNYEQNKAKDQLYLVKDFKGLSGSISFNEKGDVQKSVSLKTVREGHFKFYNN